MTKHSYPAIFPKQSQDKTVFTFSAPAKEILNFATIERAGRDEKGVLSGFQRPQVGKHIREIKEYLESENAILPNSIVVAFTFGIDWEMREDRTGKVTIQVEEGTPGWVVDGQQRLAALAEMPNRDFEVMVSGLLCPNEEELRRQFILINNTKPLPKQLIYELLPTVEGLPDRLSSRSKAASLIERLNFDEQSSLKGQIRQHTNPSGFIQDTIFQRLIMNSLSDGALRELDCDSEKGFDLSFQLLSNYFQAVQKVYPEAWYDQKPKTSRLVHGTGIMAMGYVMEHLYASQGAFEPEEFQSALEALKDHTAWTEGVWEFGQDNRRPWNSLQFVPQDYLELSQFLVRLVKRWQRQVPERHEAAEGTADLFEG